MTAPLERQFGQIPSLSVMTSSSSFGISQVTLQFDLGRDIDGAAQDVQAAINAAGSTLPRGLPYPPTYAKVNPADAPVLTLALTSPTISLRNLSDLADTLMAQRLAEVGGVGRVSIQGGIRPAVRIQADLSRLAAYGIGLEDIRQAIVGANVSGAKGSLDGAHQSYTISANDQLIGVDSYKSLVVAYRNGAPVLLTDVAQVVDGLENEKVGAWYQGTPAVVIDIQRQPGANVIETVERVKLELPRLQRAMPVGVTLTIVNDRTTTIRASIHDVQFTLAAQRRAGGAGRADVPAHRPRHHHRRRRLAAVADRDLRRDVVLRLLARQPVADGADHRDGLRRRRRHRHDREHRAPYRGRRIAARCGVARRPRDRLHRDLADDVADRRLHSAAVHDRPGRPHVPRVRADLDHRRRGFGHRLADADADDVQPHPAPPGGEGRQSGRPVLQPGARPHGRDYGRSLEWVLATRA